MRSIIRQKKTLLLFIFLGLFFLFSHVNALQIDWPNSPVGTSLDEDSTLPVLIRYLYEWGIALGGLAAFIALIIAGFQYLTSMGDPTQMKESFDRIRSAFFGIVLLLSSLLILNTINPDLTSLQLEPLNVEHLPPPETTALPNIEDLMETCETIEIAYDGEGSPLALEPNECEHVPVAGPQLKSSQAFIGGEAKDVCRGNIQFYAQSDCTIEVGTVLPPTNRVLTVSEENVNGVRFILYEY